MSSRHIELARTSLYAQVGGSETFVRLVDLFYEAVGRDELLKPMFPPDLAGPKERLAQFLMQYFGGPATYSDRRGHPRLRLRHAGFQIGIAERDRWVAHMLHAIEATGLAEPMRTQLAAYIGRAATFMINTGPDAAGAADSSASA